VLSFRDEFGQWEPRAQRPEPWTLYNGRIRRGEQARDPQEITIADIIRAVEGPLASVGGGRPGDAACPGAARELPRVWIAVRKNLRNVVEHVTVADVVGSRLPGSISELASDPEAWTTREPAAQAPRQRAAESSRT
jgi:hypothetical protein